MFGSIRASATAPQALDDDDLVDVIQRWERVAAWAAAQQLAAIAELARRRPRDLLDRPGGHVDTGHPGLPEISEFAVDEVAAALRLSRMAAGARLQLAVELVRLPRTAAALRAGQLDVPKARALAEAVTPLDDATAAAVEERVLPKAARQTVGQLRATLSRTVLAVDPAGAEARHERAAVDRRVAVSALPDGMAELWALLPADGAAALYAAVDTAARGTPAAGRGMDARRADALVDLVTGRERGSGPGLGADRAPGNAANPRQRSVAALVHVTLPAATAVGASMEPGELGGHGPIPASVARRVASTGSWRRVLTDPVSGAVVEVGRTAYSPSAALADLVRTRDRTCRFPGCRQPARRCDLDHVIAWPAGPTTAANLAALCRHHHRLKHQTGWQVEVADPATLTWTSPTGHRYTTAAPDP